MFCVRMVYSAMIAAYAYDIVTSCLFMTHFEMDITFAVYLTVSVFLQVAKFNTVIMHIGHFCARADLDC